MQIPKIEFYKLRDFGAKMNAVVEFLRENLGRLFLSLLLIGGPAALLFSLLFKNLFATFFNFGLQSGSGDFDEMADLFSLVGGNYLLMIFLSWMTITLIIGVTYSYMKFYNEGIAKTTSVSDVFRRAISRYGGLLVLGFLISMVTVIGTFFFIIPGIYLGVTLSIVYAIYMFEDDITVGGAFSKAFSLIKGKWWSTFGVIFVTYFMAYAAQMVFSVPFLVVYFIEIFSLVEDIESGGGGEPEQVLEVFSSAYMTVAMAIYMVGTYLAYSIPLIGLGYQYSNLVERSEGRGLMQEIEDFDEK